MPTETLTYRFDTSGLQQLRRAFDRARQGLEDIQQEVQQTATRLDGLQDFDDRAFGRRMQRAGRSITDLGEEGQGAATQMERAYADSIDATTKRIEGMQEALSSFTLSDTGVDLSGLAGGGGGGGGILAEAAGTGGALAIKDVFDRARFDDLNRSLEATTQNFQKAGKGATALSKHYAAMTSEMDQLLGRMDELRRNANASQEDWDRLAQDLGNVRGEMDWLENEAAGLGLSLDDLEGKSYDASGSLLGMGSALRTVGTGAARIAGPLAAVVATTTAIYSAAGAAAQKLRELSQESGRWAQELQQAAVSSGASVKQIQEVTRVAQLLDSQVDLDTVRDAFKELALRTEEAREGTGEAREAFERLGISTEELNRLGGNTGAIFDLVMRRMQGMTKQQKILTLEQIAGGEAGERLASVAGLTADEYERLAAAAPAALSGEQVEQLARIQRGWNLVQQEIQNAKDLLALEMGPFIEGALIPAFRGLVDLAGRFASLIDGAVQSLIAANPALKVIIGYLGARYGTGDLPGPDTSPDRTPGRPQTREADTPTDVVVDSSPVALLDLVGFEKLLDQPKIGTIEVDPSEALRRLLEDRAFIKSRSQDVPGPGYYEEMGRALRRSGQVGTVRMLGQAWRDVGSAIRDSLEWTVEFAAYDLGRRAADGLFSLFEGSGLSDAERTDLELRLEMLKQEEWALRESLRNREISYEEFNLRIRQLGHETAEANKRLAEESASVFKRVFRTLGDFVKQIIKQIIAQITAAIAQALALKAISSAFGVGPGGSFGQLFASAMGLTPMASGAVAYGPTPALVGEYPGARSNPELIAPADKMQRYIREAVAEAGGAQHIYIHGETRTDGRDIVTSYDTTTRQSRRKGHRRRV